MHVHKCYLQCCTDRQCLDLVRVKCLGGGCWADCTMYYNGQPNQDEIYYHAWNTGDTSHPACSWRLGARPWCAWRHDMPVLTRLIPWFWSALERSCCKAGAMQASTYCTCQLAKSDDEGVPRHVVWRQGPASWLCVSPRLKVSHVTSTKVVCVIW